MSYKILTLGLIILATTGHSQSKDTINYSPIARGDRYLSILVGYNGWSNNFGEFGVAINQLDRVGPHPLAWTLNGTAEIKLSTNETIVGPKIGFWLGGGAAGVGFGLNGIYYTDFTQGAWRLRPEVGIGLDRFRFTYGYNIALTNKDFAGINRDNISFVILLQIRRIKSVKK